MQPGRLDYAYRLSAARLAILRLRLDRHRQRLLKSSSSSARSGTLRGLAALAILCVISGSVWLGFQAGQQMGGDPVVLTDSLLVNPSAQRTGQFFPDRTITDRPSTAPPVAAALMVPATSESERAQSGQTESRQTESRQTESRQTESKEADRQAKAARLAELVSLRKTVGELQTQVQTLEQEATGLEVELLDQQIAFARAEERWKEASVERRVVYNFTNIPVGGSVSEERIESDAEQAEFPAPENDFDDQAESVDHDTDAYRQYSNINGSVERWSEDDNLADDMEQGFIDRTANYADQTEGAHDRTGGGAEERYLSAEPSPSSDLPVDEHTRQEVFFGPAADRFDDWNNQ